jgi:hypothetical protein
MYQGHKNRNYWNVALWLGNDEGLYRFALDCYKQAALDNRLPGDDFEKVPSRSRRAARIFMSALSERGITKTPDGAPYSEDAVAKAIADLNS